MIKVNLFLYAEREWNAYKDTITNISKDDKGQSLVSSDKQIYHFDKKIVPNFFNESHLFPSSADGICILENDINVIEFKKGFKRRITKNNFDVKIAECNETHSVCEKYWDLFWKNLEKEKNELLDSLKLKAIETYVTLEKHIFPLCEKKDKKININFIVVIDSDGIDETEDILEELSTNPTETSNNDFKTVRNSLARLKTSTLKNYYYDNIKVFSSTTFLKIVSTW
jgi:hypothetical protein